MAVATAFDLIIEDLYAVKFGSSMVVFIKTGKGGSCYGYENQYLNLAVEIIRITGFTVVVSANPVDLNVPFEKEFEWFDTKGIACDEIIYVGISNGAYLGARYGYTVPQISRMLLINAPLMINWSQIKSGLENFKGKSVIMAYGDKDPSYGYYELLQEVKNPCFESVVIEGVDHVFSGRDEDFRRLLLDFCLLT